MGNNFCSLTSTDNIALLWKHILTFQAIITTKVAQEIQVKDIDYSSGAL